MWWVPAMMALSAIDKNQHDNEQAKADRYEKALTAAYSPWTNLNPQNVEVTKPNFGRDVSQALFSGMSMDQNMQSAAQDRKLATAKMENLTGRKPTVADGDRIDGLTASMVGPRHPAESSSMPATVQPESRPFDWYDENSYGRRNGSAWASMPKSRSILIV